MRTAGLSHDQAVQGVASMRPELGDYLHLIQPGQEYEQGPSDGHGNQSDHDLPSDEHDLLPPPPPPFRYDIQELPLAFRDDNPYDPIGGAPGGSRDRSDQRGGRRCGRCGETGHNIRTCTV